MSPLLIIRFSIGAKVHPGKRERNCEVCQYDLEKLTGKTDTIAWSRRASSHDNLNSSGQTGAWAVPPPLWMSGRFLRRSSA
jgi:hypothetical protein